MSGAELSALYQLKECWQKDFDSAKAEYEKSRKWMYVGQGIFVVGIALIVLGMISGAMFRVEDSWVLPMLFFGASVLFISLPFPNAVAMPTVIAVGTYDWWGTLNDHDGLAHQDIEEILDEGESGKVLTNDEFVILMSVSKSAHRTSRRNVFPDQIHREIGLRAIRLSARLVEEVGFSGEYRPTRTESADQVDISNSARANGSV